MRWLIMSHLFRIYTICKHVGFGLQGWKGKVQWIGKKETPIYYDAIILK